MKRDMELVRTILLAVEAADNDPMVWVDLERPGYSQQIVSYHVQRLAEAGLLEATNLSCDSGSDWRPTSLTWAGHEFGDAARNDTVWNRSMTTLKDKAATVPFEVLKSIVIQQCKAFFGVA